MGLGRLPGANSCSIWDHREVKLRASCLGTIMSTLLEPCYFLTLYTVLLSLSLHSWPKQMKGGRCILTRGITKISIPHGGRGGGMLVGEACTCAYQWTQGQEVTRDKSVAEASVPFNCSPLTTASTSQPPLLWIPPSSKYHHELKTRHSKQSLWRTFKI